MRSYIEKAGKMMENFAASLEKELQLKYSVKELKLSLNSRYNTFEIQYKDDINGFTCAYGDTLQDVLDDAARQATPTSKLKKLRKKKLKDLICEYEELS
jgi:hypothetical protein